MYARKSLQIEIYGLITSYPYQTALKCVKLAHDYHPGRYSAPKIRGMLECDWEVFIHKQRIKYGGELLWSLERPVIVYINRVLIGSDEPFVEMMNKLLHLRLPNNCGEYKEAILSEYASHMQHSKRWYVYLDIQIDHTPIGLLVFQLYSDLLPKTCRNFRYLCSGERGTTKQGVRLSYVNTEIHRICKGGWIQGGDNVNITGGGGMSVYGPSFSDESYCVGHDRRGILSMANDGKHTNASQFVVTLQATPWMDRRYVAFGHLVEGSEVLKAIENVETFYEKPKQRIRIVDSGIMFEPETDADLRAKHLAPEQASTLPADADEHRRGASVDDDTPDTWVKIDNVLDDRDVNSDMSVTRYLAGLYSLEIPDDTYGLDVVVASMMDDILRFVSNDQYRRALLDDPNYSSARKRAEQIISDIIKEAARRADEMRAEKNDSSTMVEDLLEFETSMLAKWGDSSDSIISKLSTFSTTEEGLEVDTTPVNANYGFGYWERPDSIEAVVGGIDYQMPFVASERSMIVNDVLFERTPSIEAAEVTSSNLSVELPPE